MEHPIAILPYNSIGRIQILIDRFCMNHNQIVAGRQAPGDCRWAVALGNCCLRPGTCANPQSLEQAAAPAAFLGLRPDPFGRADWRSTCMQRPVPTVTSHVCAIGGWDFCLLPPPGLCARTAHLDPPLLHLHDSLLWHPVNFLRYVVPRLPYSPIHGGGGTLFGLNVLPDSNPSALSFYHATGQRGCCAHAVFCADSCTPRLHLHSASQRHGRNAIQSYTHIAK